MKQLPFCHSFLSLTVCRLHFRFGICRLALVGVAAGVVRAANAESDGVIISVQIDAAARGGRSFAKKRKLIPRKKLLLSELKTVLTVFGFGPVLPPHSVGRPAVLVPVGIE